MKKLALVIGCVIPFLSFAGNLNSINTADTFQELCAKEKDPVKRQHYCHMLDRHSESQSHLADFHKDTVTV
ncbi:hypothetical protein [Legionella fairfieldensis]|uniref:hypothetical protein n=1 Tax=Legionella fairfieldensis TaxID=45064 RepID=UPI00048C456A|nr:hypothetical protein [Legionella fairfieldensis]